MKLWRNATVHAEYSIVDDSRQWHAVESVAELLPKLNVVILLALIIETIHAADARAFVVAAQEEEALCILDSICKQQTDRGKLLLSSIDIVAEEEEIRLV